MTPPHPAWVFSETRAIFLLAVRELIKQLVADYCSLVTGHWILITGHSLGHGHEYQADDNQGDGGDGAVFLPELEGWRRR
jgi:hypothetical protein